MSASSITIAEAINGRILAKRFGAFPDGSPNDRPYDRGKWFRFEVVEIENIADLARALSTIESNPAKAVVRGEPTAAALAAPALRRSVARTSEPATLTESPRLWVLFDVDDLPAPDGLDPVADLEAAACYARRLLPEPFHEAACWYQATSKMGLAPGEIRIRLGFMLDRPLGAVDLKAWLGGRDYSTGRARKLCPVDTRVFYPHQLIFTAHPIFGEGRVDPFAGRKRSGLLPGAVDVVRVPEITVDTARRHQGPRNFMPGITNGLDGRLALIGDHEGGDGFHDAIQRCIGFYFAENGAAADCEVLQQRLERQIAKADRSRHEMSYVEAKIRELPTWIENIRRMEALKQERRCEELSAATCPYPEPGGTLEEGEAACARVIGDFFQSAIPLAKKLRADNAATNNTFDVEFARWKTERQSWSAARDFSDDLLAEFPEPEPAPPAVLAYPQWGIRVTPGVGKTHLAIAAVAKGVSEGQRFVFAVPNHDKADEVAADLNRAAGRPIARVWKGLDRASDTGTAMCARAEDAKRVVAAAGRISDLCGSRERGFCPFRPEAGGACAYWDQTIATPAVWVIAHATLRKTPPMRGEFDALILDERYTLDSESEAITTSELCSHPDRVSRRYTAVETKLAKMLVAVDAGRPISRSALKAVGLTAADCKIAIAGQRSGLADPAKIVRPAAPGEDTEAALAPIAATNAAILRRCRFWQILEEFLKGSNVESGRLTRTVTGVAMREPVRLDRHWTEIPILHLDATMTTPIARTWLPNLELKANIRVESAARVRQVIDPGVSYGKMVPGTGNDSDRHHTQERNLTRIWHRIEVHAAEAREDGGTLLAVLPKGAIDWIRRRYAGRLPPNLLLMHFGALRGVNGAENVLRVVVVSRQEPAPPEIENLAKALFDNGAIASLGGDWYPKQTAFLRSREGHAHVDFTVHPDPGCNSVLWQVREAEVEQAIHRARPTRRGVTRPLLIEIVAPGVFDLTVDETTTFADWIAEGDPLSVMLARGFLPDDWKGLAAVLPDTFESAEAARAAFKRDPTLDARRRAAWSAAAKPGQTPIRKVSYRGLTGFRGLTDWRGYRYRFEGARRSHRVWINLALHADPRAAWQGQAGTLDLFEPAPAAHVAQIVTAGEHAAATALSPERMLPKAPSVETDIFARRSFDGAAPRVAPLPVAPLQVRIAGTSYGSWTREEAGSPIVLVRRLTTLTQPPRAGLSSLPQRRFSPEDIADRLGISRGAVAFKKGQARFRRLGDQERGKALVAWMAAKVGPDRFQRVLAELRSN